MRAYEFINEDVTKGHNGGKLSHNVAKVTRGMHKVRDIGGYDRTYYLNRLGMGMAMADGSDKKPVTMDSSSFVEKYNTIHPYTEAEHNMLHQAMGAVPSDHEQVVPWSKSEEPDDINRASPVAPNGHDYRKRNKK